jgi:hypothetical protein
LTFFAASGDIAASCSIATRLIRNMDSVLYVL